MNETPETYADVLRAAADFITARPDLPVPHVDESYDGPGGARVLWHLTHEPEWRAHATAIMGDLGGAWSGPSVVSTFQTLENRATRIGFVELFVPLYDNHAERPTVDLSNLPGMEVSA